MTMPLITPADVPNLTLQELALWVQRLITDHPSLDRRKSSRISLMAKGVLRNGNSVIMPTEPHFQLAIQAQKDLRELHFIWTVLKPTTGDSALWSKIEEIFGDHVLPTQSRDSSSARKTQFELFVRAILARAGLTPVATAEHADFLCSLGDQKFAVEAKRVTSMGGLHASLRKAKKQHERLKCNGIACIDFSAMVDNNDKMMVLSPRAPSIPDAQRARFEFFWRRENREICGILAGSPVLGLVFFDHAIVQESFDKSTRTGRWALHTFRDQISLPQLSTGQQRLVKGIFELLHLAGLPQPLIP